MTKLRSELITVFNQLAEIETAKGRYYPSRAFKSVADTLEKCDHYLISNDRVIVSNKSNGFIKVLGNSSSEVFIEYLNTGISTRLNNDINYLSDLDNVTGIGEIRKEILQNAGINNSAQLINLNLKVGDIIPRTNLTYTNQMRVGLILWSKTKGIRISREQAKHYIDDFRNKVTNNIYVLGSYRRLKDTVGDIDIVIPKDENDYTNKIIDWMDEVLVQGETKIAGIKGNTQVDVRIIDKKFLGAHILHGTGSQEFNVKLRSHSKKLGMKLNEYGIYDKKGEFHTFDSELEVFKFLGLDYVPPEMR